jgi:hypothetical protein
LLGDLQVKFIRLHTCLSLVEVVVVLVLVEVEELEVI